MRPKHKFCCSHIAGRSMVSLFSTVYSPALFPLLSQSSDHPQQLKDAHVLPVTPSWWNLQNTGWLHTSTLLFHASPIYHGTAFQRPFFPTLPSRASSKQCAATSCHLPSWPIIFITPIHPFEANLHICSFHCFLPSLLGHSFPCWLCPIVALLPHYVFCLALPWASLLKKNKCRSFHSKIGLWVHNPELHCFAL